MALRGVNWAVAVDANGDARVRALRCSACGAISTETRLACPSCGARGALQEFDVAKSGALHAWSIVYRSFPGVETPFISAIVDMSDGTVLKGNLRGVAASPDAIKFGMPVRLVLDDAGRKDAEGNSYISYFFEAA